MRRKYFRKCTNDETVSNLTRLKNFSLTVILTGVLTTLGTTSVYADEDVDLSTNANEPPPTKVAILEGIFMTFLRR